jgi:uncharacterized protein (TIGR03118 family)
MSCSIFNKHKTIIMKMRLSAALLLTVASLCLSLFFPGCKKEINSPEGALTEGAKSDKIMKDFLQVNLVGSTDEYAPTRIDPQLVNAWGIAFTANGIAWVGSQEGHVSTVYDREGATLRAPVNIPSPGAPVGGNPTGVVSSSSTTDFMIPNPTTGSAPARFIFVGVDGQVSAWNNAQGHNAYRLANNVATAAYTGLALARNGGNNFLYAANFASGHIEVWNAAWASVSMSFTDPEIPEGYHPFNIQNVGDKLYVMYAKVGPNGRNTEHPGDGYVSIFNTDGSFVKRFTSRGQLNAPWGIAKAPASFFSDPLLNNVILVGNFGDGHINSFDENGNFLGQLRAHGQPVDIEGLWALSFPPSTSTIDPNRLYFAAGPDEETQGLFGYITPDR